MTISLSSFASLWVLLAFLHDRLELSPAKQDGVGLLETMRTSMQNASWSIKMLFFEKRKKNLGIFKY